MNESNDINRSSISSAKEKKTIQLSFDGPSLLKIAVVILIIGLAFWLGYAVGHNHQKVARNSLTTLTNPGARGGLGGRGINGGFGTVTAISSTSITVQNSRTGNSETYAITSSTTITDSGQSATSSDITTGETVIVIPSSSNSSDASRIIVNPSFGGPTGNAGAGSASGSSTLN